LIPETMGKSLEELNGEALPTKEIMVDAKENELVGVLAESLA
jgi:hypothetical protein